jgi:hypothetical protein
VIDSVGQLGTVSSSRRFKREIKAMEQASEAILSLKPVTFHYKSDTSWLSELSRIRASRPAISSVSFSCHLSRGRSCMASPICRCSCASVDRSPSRHRFWLLPLAALPLSTVAVALVWLGVGVPAALLGFGWSSLSPTFFASSEASLFYWFFGVSLELRNSAPITLKPWKSQAGRHN